MTGKTRLALLLTTTFCLGTTACQGKIAVDPQTMFPGPAPETTDDTPVADELPDELLPPFAPAGPKMRRLSAVEYANTIHDLFGDFVVVPDDLEPDTNINGFTAIGNAQTATSRLGVEQYETAALAIAEQVMTSPARNNLLSCRPSDPSFDGGCTTTFVEEMGRKVFRRALSAVEIQTYSGIAMLAARDLGDFWVGLEYGLAALLQSPNFLYRVEWGAADGAPERRKLTGTELASRLAFFLWASTPDEMLLDAAEAGELETPEQVRVQAERMLQGRRAQRGLRALWAEFFLLDGIEDQIKDPQVYPAFDADLARSMREETLLLLEHFAAEDRDFREIYSTRTTFVDDRLAELYEVEVDAAPGEFVEVTLDERTPRRGVLGHASVLSLNAHAVHNSPTRRGMFVRQSLLCQPIPPPPPNVDTTIDEYELTGRTLRDRLSVHMEQDGCSSCHLQMDPIGFGFEHFDAIGRYRTKDNGVPVDATGELDGKDFVDAADLAVLVAEHPAATRCMVRKVYRHALGHVEGDSEERLVRELDERWAESGFRLQSLLLDLVTSEGFMYVEGE